MPANRPDEDTPAALRVLPAADLHDDAGVRALRRALTTRRHLEALHAHLLETGHPAEASAILTAVDMLGLGRPTR